MALFSDADRVCVEALARLAYCNPFVPDRIAHERVILGEDFIETDEAWHKRVEVEGERPNIERMTQRAKMLADTARERLISGKPAGDVERELYNDTVLSYLFNKYRNEFFGYIKDVETGVARSNAMTEVHGRFRRDMEHYLVVARAAFLPEEADHLFACFYQLRRAFHHIYDNIIGGSIASSRLRATVWQSIFTCDVRRYRRALYQKMRDITTLITGPSGTGKELVARAIAMSQYIPFDEKGKCFATDFTRCFYPINLSALSPTLIESELFGHAKGAFTSAIANQAGFFELCPEDGAVFLDEIAELDVTLQVKLLRVLQARVFQRIGDPTDRRFEGKVVAATNRNPADEMKAGRFRDDLYYRVCSDIIVTPRLREQLEGSPEQLHNLLLYISRRVAGPDEAERLAENVAEWIEENLDPDYAWPGNVRELEQCVRNILVRNSYQPFRSPAVKPSEAFIDGVRERRLTADELLRQYCTVVYAETGNYQETARRLGLDRRTVKDRVDTGLLQALHESAR